MSLSLIHISYKPDAVRSMCCRLQLDLRELLKRGGGLFGSADMTASLLPCLAMAEKNRLPALRPTPVSYTHLDVYKRQE